MENENNNHETMWWFRLAKVLYITLYLFLPVVSFVVSGTSYDENGMFFLSILFAFLAVFSCFVILQLVKITFLYIIFAKKPQWKKDFSIGMNGFSKWIIFLTILGAFIIPLLIMLFE